MLKQLTTIEAKIINYSCKNSRKIICNNGLLMGDDFVIELNDLKNISGITDIHRLDRELDHLRSLELIGTSMGGGGFNSDDINLSAHIGPTALALNLYTKTQGYNGDPREFWSTNIISQEAFLKEREDNAKKRN